MDFSNLGNTIHDRAASSRVDSCDLKIFDGEPYENEQNQQFQQEETTQVESAIDEPYLGQEFPNIDEAKNFYNIYAFKTGFSIRKQTHYKAKKLDGMITTMMYTCSKEGKSKPQTSARGDEGASQANRTPQKEFPFKRTQCKAQLRLKMVEGGKWIIVGFIKEHNHDLIEIKDAAYSKVDSKDSHDESEDME
uniref:FAR1 domain-containing protein n=1 Tax=Ananas comosus var. bracteatus TaxID=296719 RepID=A0A6V7NPZ2_ANACO|nr:unnamed protein product [Ananas comosus var. bracteatus]